MHKVIVICVLAFSSSLLCKLIYTESNELNLKLK